MPEITGNSRRFTLDIPRPGHDTRTQGNSLPHAVMFLYGIIMSFIRAVVCSACEGIGKGYFSQFLDELVTAMYTRADHLTVNRPRRELGFLRRLKLFLGYESSNTSKFYSFSRSRTSGNSLKVQNAKYLGAASQDVKCFLSYRRR